MRVTVLKSKIHNAVVTGRDLHYEGSITIDRDLMDAAQLLPYERVHIFNKNNGSRLDTYIIEGERGSRDICINGAAARLVEKGDEIIIVAYCQIRREAAEKWKPTIIKLDSQNQITK
jgi:aspartate 1-decarboxylase